VLCKSGAACRSRLSQTVEFPALGITALPQVISKLSGEYIVSSRKQTRRARPEKQICYVDPPPHWGRRCHSFGVVLRTCIRMDDTSGG
jgi:hypothetical protein